jgi:6-phosphogluconolactonase (cycloisomerase 2 family)
MVREITHPLRLVVGCFTTRERGGRGTGLGLWQLDSSGWQELGRSDAIDNPSYLAVHPKLSVVYAAHADRDVVSAHRVDADTGAFTALGAVPSGGCNGAAVAVHPTGGRVFVANFDSGTVAAIPTNPDGSLAGAIAVLDLPRTIDSPEVTATAPQPHSVVLDPTGRFLLVPDRGLGRVHVLEVGLGTLSLTAVGYASLRPRSGPRHAVFHPALHLVYVVTEIDSTVVVCRWDGDAGVLTPVGRYDTLPGTFFRHSQTAEIAIDPTARNLYVSNRGADSISRLSLSTDGCQATLRSCLASGGRTPRHFMLAADGRSLIIANQDSDTLVALDVDDESGELSNPRSVPCPSPAMVVAL